MYRVIIVDDEPIIRKGLRETIEWDSLGLEVAGEAANGVEALRLVRSIRPEILITDIRMPEMDGLALIQEVRQLDFDVKITILSGYSDYDYLKAAIKLGVDNYLLKPIDNDELISNLKNAVSEIEKEAIVDQRNRQGSELLRTNTLRRLVTGNISPEELREKADFLDIPFTAEACLCAVIAVSPQASTPLREPLDRNGIEALAKAIPGASTIAFNDSENNLVLLMALDSVLNDRKGIQAALEGIVAKARQSQSTLTVGVGQPVNRLEEAHLSYERACKCLEYGMFMQGSGVIWFDGVPEVPSPGRTLDKFDFGKLEELIRRGDPAATQAYLDEALSMVIKENPLTPNQAHNLLMHIAVRMTDCFHEIYGGMNTYREPTEFDFGGLFRLRHFSDMRQWLHALCERLFSENAAVLGRSSSLVGLAVAYIAKHYREGVTLKQVAADCRINTSYLGQIFRKEMGCAFTDYVNGLRIREAQRLLTNPTLKVYEVAEQVGFTDYHYFLKIFKKVTGATPRDMRN